MATLMRIIRNSKTWWKKIFVVFLIIALIGTVVIFPVKTAKADDGLELFYTVSIEKGKDTAHVNINIQNLPRNGFKISFRVNDDIHSYIKNLVMDDPKGEIKYTSKNTWTVSTQKNTVNIEYDILKIVPFNLGYGMGAGNEASIIIGDSGGILMARYFFLVPEESVKSIRIKFDLPSEWKLITPYIQHKTEEGCYVEVPKITNNIVNNFLGRQGIYFGVMKFYSEKKVGNCTIKFGVLKMDQSWSTKISLSSQSDVDFYVNRTALAVKKITEILGENPYPVITLYTNFEFEGHRYPGLREVVAGCQYWPPGRYDELIGHLLYSWYWDTKGVSPMWTTDFIAKGLGESYLACRLAYDLTGDKVYLGKIYHYYLVYKRSLFLQNVSIPDLVKKEMGAYYKGAASGIYLDDLIKKKTNNSKSIYDLFGYLYKKYKNKDIQVRNEQLEEALNSITNSNNDVVFQKYINGDEEISLQDDTIQPYKDAFPEFIKELNTNDWGKRYHNYIVPFIIDIEIPLTKNIHHPFAILCKDYYLKFTADIDEKYKDLNKLTEEDIENVLSKFTKRDETRFFEIWKNIYPVTLQEIKDWLKSCLPYKPENVKAILKNNSVNLKWDKVERRYPSGYYKVIGYEIYRGISPGKEEKIATVSSNSYTDRDIEIGKTYYYYVKSVEDQPFGDGIHITSEPSKEIKVVCKDTTPPTITVANPNDFETVDNSTITVSGVVKDNLSGIDKLTINGSETSVASNSSFSKRINLIEGVNTITIVATDKAGNKATKTLTITYTPPVKTIVITLKPGVPYMTVNGVEQEIDPGRGTKPVIIAKWGRTVVPIRAIVEALGGTIEWDGKERKVTINLNETTIELWIGKPQAEVNGVMKWIDESNHNVKPIIVNGRTMLPLRFVTESLGCEVEWNPATKTITITYTP